MMRFAFRRLAVVLSLVCPLVHAADKIDRQALVTRYNPHLTAVDPWAPLSVGNGEFCFTVDVTGLQTFTDYYHARGITTETQARWSWHSNPNPHGYKLADANRPFTAYGKTLGYPTNDKNPAGQWLRENPHAMPLGQLGFCDDQGGPLALSDIANVDQTLDLWSGEIRSRFTWRGVPVEVSTVAGTKREKSIDGIAVKIISPALLDGKLRVKLAFPRGYDLKTKNNPALDWSQPESHKTTVWPFAKDGDRFSKITDFDPPDKKLDSDVQSMALLLLQRERDDFRYGSSLRIVNFGKTVLLKPHEFVIRAHSGSNTLELDWTLTQGGPVDYIEDWATMRAESAANWKNFWQSGGAIDFSGSTDPRAAELERRVVLSQYLTAIQCAGDFPPSESGLTLSTWYQKHHTEMVWWHTAHFALWGRDAFLAQNLEAFVRALPIAREIAKGRDLRGARWPKMVGPDWRESPGGNPLIVWNQPHPIHLAELLYRNTPTKETLAHYRDLVADTAECMASMLHWDEARQCYNLGPPLWIAQEIYDQATSLNPPYELSYWSRGLQIAQQWRERQGLPRVAEWDRMIAHLAPLPQKEGKYVANESVPDTWDNVASRHDHPSFLMALGQLPGDGVDRAVMARTLDAVLTQWDWETKIWGWDYPMIAMTAARLGEPKKAVDVLLKSDGPNNSYTADGHNKQREDLPIYLPGNGALLAAVAMMAAGWDGAPSHDAPGFPHDGTWVVRSEGLHPLP
jgi:hypothetical protein